jgi:hypothetical protein
VLWCNASSIEYISLGAQSRVVRPIGLSMLPGKGIHTMPRIVQHSGRTGHYSARKCNAHQAVTSFTHVEKGRSIHAADLPKHSRGQTASNQKVSLGLGQRQPLVHTTPPSTQTPPLPGQQMYDYSDSVSSMKRLGHGAPSMQQQKSNSPCPTRTTARRRSGTWLVNPGRFLPTTRLHAAASCRTLPGTCPAPRGAQTGPASVASSAR